MTNLTQTFSRTFVGVAGAILLATSCLLAAAGPAAVNQPTQVTTLSA
jgi:hypothetical protein